MNENVNLTPDGKLWTKCYKGEPLVIGYVYNIDGEWFSYAGDFKTTEEVPHCVCCFTIGDELKRRRIIPMMNTPRDRIKRKRADDCKSIDTKIKDIDSSLMILIKTALEYKNVTRGEFKQLYDNDSDMNNALRVIENGGSLSWARFTDFCQRLRLNYDLKLFDGGKENTLIENMGSQDGEESINDVPGETMDKK